MPPLPPPPALEPPLPPALAPPLALPPALVEALPVPVWLPPPALVPVVAAPPVPVVVLLTLPELDAPVSPSDEQPAPMVYPMATQAAAAIGVTRANCMEPLLRGSMFAPPLSKAQVPLHHAGHACTVGCDAGYRNFFQP